MAFVQVDDSFIGIFEQQWLSEPPFYSNSPAGEHGEIAPNVAKIANL
jgi:hypothetical protein